VTGHVVRLSAFMSMGFLSMTISGLVEAVYLGWLGTDELAAIAFSFPLTMALGALSRGIGIGASSVVARSIGGGDRARAARLVSNCMCLMLLFAAIVLTAGWLGAEFLFAAMGASGRVLALVTGYMHIWFVGFPLFALSMVGSGLMRSAGSAAMPGYVMTLGSVLQMAFAPFLIFGWLGLPALGMDGAAWAFVLARACSSAMMFWWFVHRERLLQRGAGAFVADARAILHVGVPAAATNLIAPVSTAVITGLLATFGTEVVAGFGAASRVEALVGMMAVAISSSAAPMVGQNFGAGLIDRVRESLRVCYAICLGFGVFSGLLMLLIARPLVATINGDATVVDVAAAFLAIVPWSVGFMGVMNVASSTFNALGRPLPPLVLSLARMLVLYIPMAVLASRLWGYRGIFWATATANVVMGIAAWLWSRAYVEAAARTLRARPAAAGAPAAA
jgi:putative MATE family efflux protein